MSFVSLAIYLLSRVVFSGRLKKTTGLFVVSPQYHVTHDNFFETVRPQLGHTHTPSLWQKNKQAYRPRPRQVQAKRLRWVRPYSLRILWDILMG